MERTCEVPRLLRTARLAADLTGLPFNMVFFNNLGLQWLSLTKKIWIYRLPHRKYQRRTSMYVKCVGRSQAIGARGSLRGD